MSTEYFEAFTDLGNLFMQISRKVFSFDLMQKVAQQFSKDGPVEEGALSLDIYTETVRLLCRARFETDIRVIGYFLPVFNGIFLHLEFDDWQRALAHFWSVPELRVTERGIPREQIPTLEKAYRNFELESGRAQEFLYRDEDDSGNCIDGHFVSNCRFLSLFILLGDKKRVLKQTVVNVLQDGREHVIRNLIKFMQCTPGLMRFPMSSKTKAQSNVITSLLEYIYTADAIQIPGKHEKIRQLIDGLTSPFVRIEQIAKSSFYKKMNCQPLFPIDQFSHITPYLRCNGYSNAESDELSNSVPCGFSSSG